MDRGHELTDELLDELEKKIAREYKQAIEETQKKLENYLAGFEKRDEKWQKWVADGTKTEAEYKQWRMGQIATGDRWQAMRDVLAKDYHNANLIARSVADGYKPDVYALNHNFATYEIEAITGIDTSYTLYNHQTVERLMREDPELLPSPGKTMQKKLKDNPDIAWQEGQIQSVTVQSILQGESMPNAAKRICQTMGEKNYKAAVRYARTAIGSAQNAGRLDSYKRAQKMGISMRQMWVATLDNRTRHEHRLLDGQVVDLDEPFEVDGEKLRFPLDPTAAGYLVYNCRCTTVPVIKGFEKPVNEYEGEINGMTYEEWKHAKERSLDDEVAKITERYDNYMPDNLVQLGNLSESTIDNVRYAVASMDEQEAEKWKKNIAETTFIQGSDDEVSGYLPALDVVQLNSTTDDLVFFHEVSHAKDANCLHIAIDEWYSVDSASAYIDELIDQAVSKGATPDVITLCNKMGMKLNASGDWISDQYEDITPPFKAWMENHIRLYGEKNISALSDMIDGVTNGDIEFATFRYGYHGKAYYQSPTRGITGSLKSQEAWANYCAFRATNAVNELNALDELMPIMSEACKKTYMEVYGV